MMMLHVKERNMREEKVKTIATSESRNNNKTSMSCNCILYDCYLILKNLCIYFIKSFIYTFNRFLLQYVLCCRKDWLKNLHHFWDYKKKKRRHLYMEYLYSMQWGESSKGLGHSRSKHVSHGMSYSTFWMEI